MLPYPPFYPGPTGCGCGPGFEYFFIPRDGQDNQVLVYDHNERGHLRWGDYAVGPAGPQGPPGADSTVPGPATEMRVGTYNGEQYIQYRPVGTSTWTNIINVASLIGPQGTVGPQGPVGPTGPEGRRVYLRVYYVAQNEGYIQWQREGDAGWQNLIPLTELKGPQGDQGPAGVPGPTGPTGPAGPAGADGTPVELRATTSYIQWRLEGSDAWTNLVSLTSITGPRGPQGVQGPAGSPGAAGASVDLRVYGEYIQWKRSDTSTWNNLIPLSALEGPMGPSGPGVASGGLVGQFLVKSGSADYATSWQTVIPGSGIQSVVAGTNIHVDDSDQMNPVVSCTAQGLPPTTGLDTGKVYGLRTQYVGGQWTYVWDEVVG